MAFVAKSSAMRMSPVAAPTLPQRNVSVGIFKKKSAAAPAAPAKTATKAKKEEPKRKEEGMFSQTMNALNFSAEATSKKDADLLYEAKYGKKSSDGKMTPEQYAALRRKVTGTASDFFKGWVEEEQVKIPTYYKPDDKVASVPFLPVLVGVLVAVLATTVVLFAQ